VRVGSKFRRWIVRTGLAVLTVLLFVAIDFSRMRGIAQDWVPSPETFPLQAHPLPETLDRRQDPNSIGDYFAQIQTTPAGYLVWSKFPVKIYIEVPNLDGSFSQDWVSAVSEAVEAWGAYLPLETINRPENADITISRRRPPPERFDDGTFRARSALTRYEFYQYRDPNSDQQMLCHRFEMTISPSQTGDYVRAAVLHELGHALGIWGHSPIETDALYFAQVRQPQGISTRDINTLKRVYQQPTRLGWWMNINQL
jgi:predicted Zn-dependent protease